MTNFLTTACGDQIAFDKRGAGPALIFIAGAGPHRATDSVTTATAEILASLDVTTIVFDRLGRGQSQAGGVLDLDGELEVIATLIEHVGGSAVLCGHSSGCSIALKAATSGNAVDGLAVNGLALWEAPITPETDDTIEWANEFLRLLDADEFEAAQVHYMKDMPPEWLEGARNSPMWPDIVKKAASLRADAESLAWAASTPHPDLFGDVHVPVIVMVGESTLPIMEAAAGSITAAIPGARLRQMPGADHLWEPEPMAVELARFVHGVQMGTVQA